MRLVAMLAHPDDAEILVAGTLFHLKDRGWELGIVTMTAGDCGSSTGSREEISRTRLAEAAAAAQYLGAQYECAGFSDNEIFAGASSLRRSVELLRQFDPDVVITHSPVDYMFDHEETSRLARAAAFAAAMPLYATGSGSPHRPARGTPALYYADPIEGTGAFGQRIRPGFYVDITAQMERKRHMLSLHASQRTWLRAHHGLDEYLDRMTAWAEQYGRECGLRYAEGLRQHLGHGYPQGPVLQEALGSLIVTLAHD